MNTQPITPPSWWRIRFSHSASYELKLKMSLIFEFATKRVEWSGSKVHATLLALLSVLRLPPEHLFCPLFLSLRRMVLQSLAPFSYRFSFFLCSLMCFAILMPRGKVPHSCRVGTFRQGRRCHGLAVPPFMFCGRYPASQPRYTQERQRCVLAM